MEQDGANTVNADEKDAVLHRVEERIIGVEGMLGQKMEESHAQLRSAKLANDTLQNENKELKERVAQLETEQKQAAEYRIRLEYQLKREQDLATIRQDHFQREQETLARTGLENEAKRAFQQQKSTQLQSEQKATERRTDLDELQKLRKELELSAQREREQEKQYQADLASSKDENDALRKQVKQLEQRSTIEQAKAWRAGASKMEGRLREAERERDSLKTHNEALVAQINKKSNAGTAHSKVGQLEREKQEAIRAAAATTEEYGKLSTRYRQLEVQLDAAKKDQTRVEEAYKRKLEQATSQLNQSQNLLTLRTGELKGAQAFLSTADQFAGADLIKDLEQLNAEIMQLAASVADELVTKEKPVVVPTEETREGARKFLGRKLVDLLTSSTTHDAQIVIQTAIQTAIVAHAQWIISTWLFDGQESEGTINNIYQRVRNAGKLQYHL